MNFALQSQSAMALDIGEAAASIAVAGEGVTAAAAGTVNSTSISSASDLADHIYSLFENGTFKLPNGPGDWSIEHCVSWHRLHHLYFQLGNALFLIAFLLPHGSYSLLCSRCALVIGSILLTMWGYLIECSADVVVWHGSFLFINVVYLIVLLCRLRPVRFDKEIEAVSTLFTFISYLFPIALSFDAHNPPNQMRAQYQCRTDNSQFALMKYIPKIANAYTMTIANETN